MILIILATVSINAIFGEGGLVGNAEDAKFRQEKAEAQERLELVLADAYTEKITTTEYTQEEFLNEHLEEFVYDQEPDAQIDVRDEQDIISLNGHTFELDRSVPKLGDWLGFDGKLLPAIRRIDVTSKTDTSATIQVTTARTDGVDGIEYRYSIKKQNEGDDTYSTPTTKSENTHEFIGLVKEGTNTIYTAKVELLQNGVVVSTKYKEIIIGQLDKGVVRFEEGKWENGKASVKIVTDEKGYTLQYQIVTGDAGTNDSNWIDTTSGSKIENLQHGQTVYGRLWNGIDESEPAEFWVKDTVDPIIDNFTVTETKWNKITVQVEARDLETNLAETDTYKYYLNDETTPKKVSTEPTYTFENLTDATNYKLRVEVYDNVGNVSEKTISSDTRAVITKIYTKEDMEEFRNTVNEGCTYQGKTVELMNDIDLKGNEENQWVPIGDPYILLTASFNGTFEGNGYAITNIYISQEDKDFRGLFSIINGAILKNVVVNGEVLGNYLNGGLVAQGLNSEIYRCVNLVSVTSIDYNAGGIVRIFA